ncbi:hypothetical protein, partial [Streptomyces sp. NPDC047014]|uniref:hypothetical protein n=1 Tax=Streptomyces sp. NPDC047014 TaxID=3155736 RepID=UPI0033E7CACA
MADLTPTQPHGLTVARLRRQIEAQSPEVMAPTNTDMGDPLTGLTKVPDLLVIAEADADDTAMAVNSRDVLMVMEVVCKRRKAPHRTLKGLVRGFPTMIVRRRPTLPQGP